MEPTSIPEAPTEAHEPVLEPTTRRTFIRGVAAAGVSTAAVLSFDRAGVLNLETNAVAQARPNPFSSFDAIAASDEDIFEVPEGFRADVLISYGDEFRGTGGTLRYGYNNDFLAFFPLPAGSSSSDEGLIFVNHEYPAPFLQHGNPNAATKTPEQIALEQESVGNAVVHIRRDAAGVWRVVSPSRYNRRVTGRTPVIAFTGPLASNPAFPGIGAVSAGSVANCSGGVTPWGTALSCEENYQDYATTAGFGYGWTRAKVGDDDYYNGDGSSHTVPTPGPDNGPGSSPATLRGPAKYGWVVEHDPYDPESQPRKHTALGRFRHENTAFRAEANRPFVLYMGDDRNDGGVYKFVSTRGFVPGDRGHNLQILTEGTLYIAKWDPEGRRRFDPTGNLLTPGEGTGEWVEVQTSHLVDTHTRIRGTIGVSAWDRSFATNRPEDLEVDEDGTVYIALTNNSVVNDIHGSVRTLREADNDAAAVGPGRRFTWREYAAGGRSSSQEPGVEGFSSPDNLVFDKGGNLWVVTDISSSSLNVNRNVTWHRNNALFMVPRTGPNAGIAYRFANMPVQSEGTGPWFTPDEQTLFINVQHPGEESSLDNNSDPTKPETYLKSYWPDGSQTKALNPTTPRPSTVTITRVAAGAGPGARMIPAAAAGGDEARPTVGLAVPERPSLRALRGDGLSVRVAVDEPGSLRVSLHARVGGGGRLRRIALEEVRAPASGERTVTLRPGRAVRLLLRGERRLAAVVRVEARDAAGNRSERTQQVTFR